LAGYAEGGEEFNSDFFEQVDEIAYAEAVFFEIDNRIYDDLAGVVSGGSAAAADLKNFYARLLNHIGSFEKFVCALSCTKRNCRRVFDDEYSIFSGPLRRGRTEVNACEQVLEGVFLQVKGGLIVLCAAINYFDIRHIINGDYNGNLRFIQYPE